MAPTASILLTIDGWRRVHSISLRTLICAVGIFVSVVTTVSLPIGYFIIGNATIANVGPGEGSQPPSPVSARGSSLALAGTDASAIESAKHPQELLRDSVLLAVLSGILGLGLFLGVRTLPFKVLDKTLGTLANANSQFSAALNYMSQGLLLFDPDKRILVVNRKYIELYGLSPKIVKPGCTINELLTHRKHAGCFSGDVDQYCAELDAALAQGKTTSSIVEATKGRFVHLVNQPMPNGGWVATHEDITERHNLLRAHDNAERLLREQKLQLDTALNNMVHGLCMFDAQGRVVLFNERYRELMALPGESLLGRSLLDIMRYRKSANNLMRDPDQFFASLLASVRAGKTTTKIMETTQGQSLRVIDRPMPTGGWVATFEDITEQRRIEQERDRNREFLDQIIENVPAAIFVKNADDRKYVLANRAAEKFWGASRADILGKTAHEVFSKEEADLIAARDEDLLQANALIFDEREINFAEGRRSISSRRLTIQDNKGNARYLLGVIEDVTDRKRTEQRIAHLAHYDALTELPNRVLLREKLEQELAFVRRGGQLAVLYLDLDHFKSVNDTLGHSTGDELLKAVTARMQDCLRACDIFARLGGDEFAIVQTGIEHPTDAAALAQRIRDAITHSCYDLNGHQVVVDISIGIALAPDDSTEADQLLKYADMALYGAKSDGRGTFRYFESEMDARMKMRRSLEVELRKALLNNEFELHYQPIVRFADNAVSGCEALLRWNHPERGLISPADFIPVAEETGLINAIGEWVLRQACAEAATWPDHIKIAVNASPVQFRSQDLPQTVIKALTAANLAPHRLELEITESVLMQSNDTTLRRLHQLRELGVRISMDDFGTGHSSLSYLRSFPLDKIKIDRSFVNDLSNGNEGPAIMQAILTLANSLNMTTTAEGVETECQAELLRAMGCVEMQGFLFSAPKPRREIAPLLASHTKRIASAA